jgi:hypothetical protein
MSSMTQTLVTTFQSYPYLFTNIISLILCILVSTLLGRQGKIIILSGLLSTPPFFLSAAFEVEYWNPVRLGGWVTGLEDALCSFDVGAMAWIPVALLFNRTMNIDIKWNRFCRNYSVLGILSLGFFVLFILRFDALTSLLATYIVLITVLLLLHPHLWQISIVGGLGFSVLYVLIVKFYFLLWPDFVSQWKVNNFWGELIWGLPRGEIAYAFSFGFFWPLFIGYVFNISLIRSDLRARIQTG